MLVIQLTSGLVRWSWTVSDDSVSADECLDITGTAACYHDACRDALVAYEQRRKEEQ